MTEVMKDWALKYADIGLAVFPLIPKDKRPATVNGCKAATTDKRQIENWWNQNPDYNIGIATGSVSGGLLVIDLDIDENKGVDGYETLKQWQRDNGELPDTWQSITGRGGYHIFFKDSAVNQNRVGLYEGIDIRGEGGYIVAPPSLHPNGRRYEWEQEPGEYMLAQADNTVVNFLLGPFPENLKRQTFQEPETIPDGERTSTMIRLVGSLKAKGLDNEAIQAAVRAENEKKCVPPLTDKELEKTVFPALKRGWKATAPYNTVFQDGRVKRGKNKSEIYIPEKPQIIKVSDIEEKEPEWLIEGYIPKRQITVIAGDGGSGKTTLLCNIVASVSTGKNSIFENNYPDGFYTEPKKVLFLSSEDSFEYTLLRKLRKSGADIDNVITIPISDKGFQEVKFNSDVLTDLIRENMPALALFDPLQSFIPSNIQMGQRNAMRDCLNPLIGLGEKYGTTFAIIMHTNKQAGTWGRKRMADSSDVWDIARSVLLVGETNEKGIRYISQEKSNYGKLMDTILFSIEDETAVYKSLSEKKDKDFVTEIDYNTRQAPQREDAKRFILDFLKDGEKEVSELDAMAKAQSISTNSLKNAKADLKKEGLIKYRTVSLGRGQGTKFHISLIDTGETN